MLGLGHLSKMVRCAWVEFGFHAVPLLEACRLSTVVAASHVHLLHDACSSNTLRAGFSTISRTYDVASYMSFSQSVKVRVLQCLVWGFGLLSLLRSFVTKSLVCVSASSAGRVSCSLEKHDSRY